jgi:hypothetical protein
LTFGGKRRDCVEAACGKPLDLVDFGVEFVADDPKPDTKIIPGYDSAL